MYSSRAFIISVITTRYSLYPLLSILIHYSENATKN